MWPKKGRIFIECFDRIQWRQKYLQVFKDLGMTEMTENPPAEQNDKGERRAISELLFAQ